MWVRERNRVGNGGSKEKEQKGGSPGTFRKRENVAQIRDRGWRDSVGGGIYEEEMITVWSCFPTHVESEEKFLPTPVTLSRLNSYMFYMTSKNTWRRSNSVPITQAFRALGPIPGYWYPN